MGALRLHKIVILISGFVGGVPGEDLREDQTGDTEGEEQVEPTQ